MILSGWGRYPKVDCRVVTHARDGVDAAAMVRDVVYVRPLWRVVMAVIRTLPEGIFKRTSL